jgi:2-polyprenyl-3-methyl-5-hydroxy-6-metoxy-1,4-benzoquinol methylase
MVGQTPKCKICGGQTVAFGEKPGREIKDVFRFVRCSSCNFISVENACLDYAGLYSREYYQGRGADPLVDYYFELEHSQKTLRRYEWRGIAQVVNKLVAGASDVQWLDYGCGNGGLVRYLRDELRIDAVGYDEGAIVDDARAKGIPILTKAELAQKAERFSVITMIEVIEHLPDPIAVLRQVRGLLKPGGVLFVTTGNSEPHLSKFLDWGYVMPEIHVSYFTPQSLALALAASNFSTSFPGYIDGWSDIIRFKFLKTLGFKRSQFWERFVPWGILSRVIDMKYKASAHPVGRAQEQP